MVEEVVSQIVANVAENSATKDLHCREPIVEKYGMCQLPEWGGEYDEQRGWHDQSIFIHREIVVNAVKQEVKGQANAIVGKPARIQCQQLIRIEELREEEPTYRHGRGSGASNIR